MLALTRKKGEALVINNDEKIKIGTDITVTLIGISGDQVKIGISAPKEVPIYRKEIYLQIQKENEESMNVEGLDALKKLL